MSVYSLIGYNIAHGYSVNDGFGSHAGVLGPQTSNQFHSRESLNANQDSVWDGMQAMSHQSFVSPQQEPVQHENNEDASSVTSLGQEMVQSKPHSGREPDKFAVVPSVSSVQKYEHESSGNQHPFGLLIKDTQEKTMGGISFPTTKDFKQFIETMKSSFLTPGSDLRRHFQTAREMMKNEVASTAQNIKAEPDTGNGSNSAKEGTAHDDVSENEVWSEPMNAAFEEGEQDANYQMPSESLSVPDPVDSAASLSQGSPFYTLPHLAAKELVSSNYGSFDNGAISGENPDIFTNAPDVQNEDIHSTSYKLPEQIPSGSLFGEHFSFSGHMTAPPVNSPNSPAQDFSYYPSKKSKMPPLTSEKNIQQTIYKPHSKDSLTVYEKPSGGFELGEDFQSEELGNEIPGDVSAPNPPPLNSYGKSIYVSARKGQLNIPDYLLKHRERPAPSFQPYQPTVGKESRYINDSPTVHQPVSISSVSSSSNLSPQSSSGHVGVQLSSPHDSQNQAFNRKQPVRSHHVFNVKPPSSLHGSSRHDGYLGDQRVSMAGPSILTDQEKDEEISDLSEYYPVSAIQESKQMTDNTLTPISDGLDSTQSEISSPVKFEYSSFNSLSNLAPPSASVFSRLVGNEVMSRNFGIKNIISDRFPTGDIHGARNILGSFFTPQRRGMSLNGGYIGATRAGLLQTFIQPTKVWNRPTNVNKEPGNMAYQTPNPPSASKVFGSTVNGGIWRNGGKTKTRSPLTGRSSSTPFVNAYIMKSRNSYARGKVTLSKTHYDPYQLDEEKTGAHQWKPAPQYVSNNPKGFEEP